MAGQVDMENRPVEPGNQGQAGRYEAALAEYVDRLLDGEELNPEEILQAVRLSPENIANACQAMFDQSE